MSFVLNQTIKKARLREENNNVNLTLEESTTTLNDLKTLKKSPKDLLEDNYSECSRDQEHKISKNLFDSFQRLN